MIGAARRGALPLEQVGEVPPRDVDVVLDYLWGSPAADAMRAIITARSWTGPARRGFRSARSPGPNLSRPVTGRVKTERAAAMAWGLRLSLRFDAMMSQDFPLALGGCP